MGQKMKESDIRDNKVFDQYVELVAKDVEKIFKREQFGRTPCPACGGTAFQDEFDKNGFTYVTCNDCGTLFCNPRPSAKQLDDFYSRADSGRFFAESFFQPFAEARREKIFLPRVREVAEKFPQYSQGRIGDIGAGYGIFLEELRKVWSEAELIAIEPSEDMIKICQEKQLCTIPQMFEDIVVKAEEQFDLLCSFELFEHLGNPEIFIRKCNSVLKRGGYLLVTTLNGLGFDLQILWGNHKNVNPPVHLNFFNPGSMEILLNQCGFEVVEAKTPGRLDWDIVEETHKRGEVKLERFWQQIVGADTKVKDELQEWISQNGFSSHMQIIARKVKDVGTKTCE